MSFLGWYISDGLRFWLWNSLLALFIFQCVDDILAATVATELTTDESTTIGTCHESLTTAVTENAVV
jgi:hypothetical protein